MMECLQILELQGQLSQDARALACEAELGHALVIVRGTCVDRQLDLYRHAARRETAIRRPASGGGSAVEPGQGAGCGG